jgi:hypothetical protein
VDVFVEHPVTVWNALLQTFRITQNFNGEYLIMRAWITGFRMYICLYISIQCFKNHIHLKVYTGEDIQLFRHETKKKKTWFRLLKRSLFEMFTCRHAVDYCIQFLNHNCGGVRALDNGSRLGIVTVIRTGGVHNRSIVSWMKGVV